jgi:predicted permease
LVQLNFGRGGTPPGLVDAWRATGMFEALEATSAPEPLRFDEEPAMTARSIAAISPGLLEMLAVRPIRGRAFDAEFIRAGIGDAIWLSETIWRSRFGSDPRVVGRRVTINNASWTLEGILPAGFRFPSANTVAWRPLAAAAGLPVVFARLAPGVRRADAAARMTELARQVTSQPQRAPLILQELEGVNVSETARRAVELLAAGVALVFLVLAANVSGLLLARLSARRREFGMCAALGASRGRLIRQAAWEHALIGVVAAAGGAGIAWMLVSWLPEAFLGRSLNPIDLDARALSAVAGLGVAAVLLSGLWPAWLGTRANAADLALNARQQTDSSVARITTRGLIVVEIALACALLVGSGMLLRSFAALAHADRGLDVRGVVRASVAMPPAAFGDERARALALSAIQEYLTAWPVIAAVTASQGLPPATSGSVMVTIRSDAPDAQAIRLLVDSFSVSPTYFEFYGIPILRGRGFQPGDPSTNVVVGERLARLLWADADPIGRTFTFATQSGVQRVVGVARETTLPTLDAAADRPEYYRPFPGGEMFANLSLRCRAACPDPLAIRARILEAHPAVTASASGPIEDAYALHLRVPRAVAGVGGLFAGVAVVTAAAGLFSVLTFAVARRRREFGIRTALGGSPRDVRRLIVREGLALAAVGVAAGALGGWIIARALAAFRYGVSTADPLTWAGVIGTLCLTSLLAAWRPSRQAARVDPVTLLREE